MIVTLGKAK